MVKILVANPNRNKDLTEMFMKSARKNITNPDTELIPFTNPLGSLHCDCYFADYQSTWSFIRALLEEVEKSKPDAVVIAGFGNFGIFALKEALDIPCLSIAEISQTIACTLGHKYSILTVLKSNVPYQEDLVKLLCFQEKCASVRGMNVDTMTAKTSEETKERLKKEIETIILEDRAEVVVLGGARFCVYADELSKEIGIPILDPVDVTVKMAEMYVQTGLCQSKRGKFSNPPQKLNDYFWMGN